MIIPEKKSIESVEPMDARRRHALIECYDLSPRQLKLEFDQDIFHIEHLCKDTAKSIRKRRC